MNEVHLSWIWNSVSVERCSSFMNFNAEPDKGISISVGVKECLLFLCQEGHVPCICICLFGILVGKNLVLDKFLECVAMEFSFLFLTRKEL